MPFSSPGDDYVIYRVLHAHIDASSAPPPLPVPVIGRRHGSMRLGVCFGIRVQKLGRGPALCSRHLGGRRTTRELKRVQPPK